MNDKEFWEWCGFKIIGNKHKEWLFKPRHTTYRGLPIEIQGERWLTPDGGGLLVELPKTDLNNLFKYAVPKLFWEVGPARWEQILTNWIQEICLRDMLYQPDRVALALRKAIEEVLKSGEVDKGL